MQIDSLAPIVLFIFNRLNHTKKTVEALKKNHLASDSELFIYSDGANNLSDKVKVSEVRKYIKTINGFKKITIIERDKNWGLAKSITDGVTEIVNRHNKIIVLEDDLVTSSYFLKFMNESLQFYEHKKKVWHISGWNYPIDIETPNDVFLWRLMNCWGWATWSDRWRYYEKNSKELIKMFKKEEIYSFNIDGSENFFKQLIDNQKGVINTWAIYWYASIYKNKGLCLNPKHTFVLNIGNDGGGTNKLKGLIYSSKKLNLKKNISFTEKIHENKESIKKLKQFYNKWFIRRVKEKIISIFTFIK